MAYEETPKKPIEIRDGRDSPFENHDKDIAQADAAGVHGDRTDAGSQGVGYLGIDDIDRIRRKNLKHKTR